MSIRPPPRTTARPVTPDDCHLMRAILNAAQQMFAGDPWEDVEPHLRRAWRTVLDPTPWDDVRDWMHASWLKLNSDWAANDSDGHDGHDDRDDRDDRDACTAANAPPP